MFAQANSEHCRHKIFNADWIVDGVAQEQSLFAMIRAHAPRASAAARSSPTADNAAVMEGATVARFLSARRTARYGARERADAHR